MKEIELPHGLKTKVDDGVYLYLNQFKWYANTRGYAVRAEIVNGKTVITRMHRAIMGCPDGFCVDHINHDTLDNQMSNLRICTCGQNQRNSLLRKDNTSGYKGVSRNYKGWRSQIKVNGKKVGLGTFDTPQEAARAYDKKAKELFGEFANLNFPDQEEKK